MYADIAGFQPLPGRSAFAGEPHPSPRFAPGAPTEYGFELPRRRHALAKPHVAGADGRVLDFGCGNGANTVLFAPDVRSVCGVDVAWEHLARAARHRDDHGPDNVRYVLYDGGTLPFAEATFDHAVSFEVLEHTADDRHALAELHRVLKPGGALVLTVPNKWYLMETHGFDLRPRWVRWSRVPLLSWLPTAIHERYARARIYTRRRIFRRLREAGFDVLEHRYVMPPFDKVERALPRALLRAAFRCVEASPLRVIGVAHFIASRRRP